MKIAISLPDALFDETERYALHRGVARSQLIAEALAEYLDKHGPEATTAKLDEVYSSEPSDVDPALQRAQIAALDDEAW
ncbi:MAG: ribbon-helix-helix domain-containing protein [Candidatus Wenzhouxiangella sp. M2_3B_020]